MSGIGNYRQKKIYEIISVVKIVSLLFGAMILFKYYLKNEVRIGFKSDYMNIISLGIYASFIALIYIVWLFFINTKFKNMKIVRIIEDITFILIFLLLILLSGTNASQYKFLFLFIIMTSTIESGIKHGMFIAILSSMISLGVDIIYIPNTNINNHFEDDLILGGIFILTAWTLGYYVKVENEYIDSLATLANVDGLTGVYNHRFFHESLKKEVDKSKDKNLPLSMILIDIDNFKYYNDLYGHQQGDEVLKNIGIILTENTRQQDIVARYGGEEFAIILPETEEKKAIDIAEKIRFVVEQFKFKGEENQPNGSVTISLGISTFPRKAKSCTELINSSDDALYRAKFLNKNRVEIYYSILEELKEDIEEEHLDLITSIKTLISVINAKDQYTYAHIERVVMYCKLLADKLQLSEEEKNVLKYGAYLHDIGKINISKEILNKKMPLEKEEWDILKQHPFNGVEIIKPVKSLKKIIPLILHHHERYDGTGYPNGLIGENIPYLARILTVVDSFDSMTSNRPYNIKKSFEEGILELRKYKNTQFDPYITEKFIEIIEKNKDKLDTFISHDKV